MIYVRVTPNTFIPINVQILKNHEFGVLWNPQVIVIGMQRLDKSCPLVEIATEDSGRHTVAGVGVEHMRILQKDLKKD